MRYYTVKEIAKKLKVSPNHVYALIKRGELNKAESIGRAIRVSGAELSKIANKELHFPYNAEKIEIIETSLGKVRKIKGQDLFVLTDVAKCLGFTSSRSIRRYAESYTKINYEEAKELGLAINQFGLVLMNTNELKAYSCRSTVGINWSKFLKELKVEEYKQQEFKEEIEEFIDIFREVREEPKNNMQIFKNSELGNIRTLNIDNKTWFIGKDVAEILGYENPSKALSDHVEEEDKLNNKSLFSLGQRGGWLINESGLYSLIFGSKLPQAKAFKRWVTSEVLPTIHKTGGYVANETKFVNNYFNSFSPEVKQAMIKDLQNKNDKLFIQKEEVDKALNENIRAINQIRETLNKKG